MVVYNITTLRTMPTSPPSLIKANFKRFMYKPELRIEKATSLSDLASRTSTSFGIRCHVGKLSMKVEKGYLVKHRYTQGKKGID
ncbi:conserved hypothetical protein [Vibrio crassostreae]|nr:conserved hypothetical protein [Vibrio crassostreae]CAK2276366.1 conserved hypothetical protein [Vibrio crassostreae]CAK2412541.1 conserved hypothetical protein [Vibrio crassostreae]CAK2646813.1 conserved hypothetical protein [Vibrio crassostreae]